MLQAVRYVLVGAVCHLLTNRLIVEPPAQIDQDCAHIAKERVVVLKPLHCAGWRSGC